MAVLHHRRSLLLLSLILVVSILCSQVFVGTVKVVRADDDDNDNDDLDYLGDDLDDEDEDEAGEMEGGDDFQGEDEGEFPADEEGFGGDEMEGEGEEEPPAEDVDDGDVVTLTSSNFGETVATSDFVMVEFYAPWCGHCQALAPAYREAASVLKPLNVTLAKVDATVETELGETYGVTGFPTIYFFIRGAKKEYSGGRRAADIVTWVKKKIGLTQSVIATSDDVDRVLAELESNPIMIGYFADLEGAEAKAFTAAARDSDGVSFHLTSDKEIAENGFFKKGVEGVTAMVAVLKYQEEIYVEYDGDFTNPSSLSSFATANRLPLFITFSEDNSRDIFGGDIHKHLLVFVSQDNFDEVNQIVAPIARQHKGTLLFVHIDSSDKEKSGPVAEYFNVEGEETQVIGFNSEGDKKYKMAQEVNAETLQAFANSMADGSAVPFLKSEPIPEKNDDPVTVVVGNSFNDIVLDPKKDVLLEIYAPWCGHCQALEPTYKKLGELFKDIDSVIIAKMDGTANEHPSIDIEGFPTIYFYPAGKKDLPPLSFEAGNKVKTFVRFIKKNAAIPFELKKKGEKVEEVVDSAPATAEKDEL